MGTEETAEKITEDLSVVLSRLRKLNEESQSFQQKRAVWHLDVALSWLNSKDEVGKPIWEEGGG